MRIRYFFVNTLITIGYLFFSFIGLFNKDGGGDILQILIQIMGFTVHCIILIGILFYKLIKNDALWKHILANIVILFVYFILVATFYRSGLFAKTFGL